MHPLSPDVISSITWGIPSVAIVVWLIAARRDKGILAGLAVVAFGVAAALAQAAGGHLLLMPLTTFAGTAALLVRTVRRRVGAVLGATTLVAGVAAAHDPADVVGALGGAVVAALAVGVAIPLWGWLSPRPLGLDDLGPDDLGIDYLGLDGSGLDGLDGSGLRGRRPTTSTGTSVTGSVSR